MGLPIRNEVNLPNQKRVRVLTPTGSFLNRLCFGGRVEFMGAITIHPHFTWKEAVVGRHHRLVFVARQEHEAWVEGLV